MVNVNIHLYKFEEFKIDTEKFADEFILTIQTPQGTVNFMSTSLRDLEELTKKMWAEVKYRTLISQREEAAI
ncbi:TPA: hypothetical protein ACNABL_004753 [Escherichia coli]